MINMPSKLLIIDDHRIFADGLSAMLQQCDQRFNVTTRYRVSLEPDSLSELDYFDLLLIDIHMPNLSGLNLLQALDNRKLTVKVLVISGSDNLSDVENALRLGAKGFVPKSLPSVEMVQGINKVLSGETFLPHYLADTIDWSLCNPLQASNAPKPDDIAGLRQRQLQVLSLMHQGNSNSQIASILGLEESTIKSHISLLFKALKSKNRTSAVKRGLELGLIQDH